jgi:hypothetical protein
MTEKKLEDVAEDLKRRMGYTTGPVNTDDVREKHEPPKPPTPPGEHKTASREDTMDAEYLKHIEAGFLSELEKISEALKLAGMPPPLPAAAMRGVGGMLGKATGTIGKNLASGVGSGVKAPLLNPWGASPPPLPKMASDLTEEARSHIAKKNFAVPAKSSNTGEPAYPIEDKAHARAALGFAAMHHDKSDLAKVRAKVEDKFPGMVHEKEASEKTAILDSAVAALLGANKAQAAGQNQGEGALRGGVGWMGGASLGGLAGGALGGALGHESPVLPVLGYGLGGLAGYKALTSKYKEKKEKKASEELDTGKQASAAFARLAAVMLN